jgi:hypothetical protein
VRPPCPTSILDRPVIPDPIDPNEFVSALDRRLDPVADPLVQAVALDLRALPISHEMGTEPRATSPPARWSWARGEV